MVSTPAGLALGVAAYRVRDQVSAWLSLGFPAVQQVSTSGRGPIEVIEPRPFSFAWDPLPFPRGRSGSQGSRSSRAPVSMDRPSATSLVHQAGQHLWGRVAGLNRATSCALRSDVHEEASVKTGARRSRDFPDIHSASSATAERHERVCGRFHSIPRRRNAPCRTPGYDLSPAQLVPVSRAFRMAAALRFDVLSPSAGSTAMRRSAAAPGDQTVAVV
jgi:hypothetical protein